MNTIVLSDLKLESWYDIDFCPSKMQYRFTSSAATSKDCDSVHQAWLSYLEMLKITADDNVQREFDEHSESLENALNRSLRRLKKKKFSKSKLRKG